MGHDDHPERAADASPQVEVKVEKILAQEGASRMPSMRRDLVTRTIRRIQNWMVLGDLLRFVTLENYWKAIARNRDAGRNPHDSKNS